MNTHSLHKPEDLPRHLTIAIIGETALERLRQVAQRIHEEVAQLLAERKTNPTAEQKAVRFPKAK